MGIKAVVPRRLEFRPGEEKIAMLFGEVNRQGLALAQAEAVRCIDQAVIGLLIHGQQNVFEHWEEVSGRALALVSTASLGFGDVGGKVMREAGTQRVAYWSRVIEVAADD